MGIENTVEDLFVTFPLFALGYLVRPQLFRSMRKGGGGLPRVMHALVVHEQARSRTTTLGHTSLRRGQSAARRAVIVILHH
ncbi:hypothetical protein [Streptomyces sp. UH6]|uniref:hypothetical protein n=1 Tax=Streptomyces sp. UH6 TaxID=2748379 RepID=UPI0015D50237|nr:hypothetical protein [Streptomyces sp. UH6]NYV73934.1 hypothetical protein [Streptomyces sp. UH6]